MWSSVISLIGKGALAYFSNKREVSQGKHQAKMQTLANESSWELEVIKKSDKTWKDEVLLIIFCVPMVMLFAPFPEWNLIATKGLERLGDAPTWYTGILGVMVAATFGVRKAANLFERKKANQRKDEAVAIKKAANNPIIHRK